MSTGPEPPLKIKIQLHSGSEIAMGPGKADLLDAIMSEGSISAAGRKLGMSYRRTWLLVDAMNRCWDLPLVETAAGGSHGGGARVSDLGRSILERYRALQAAAATIEDSDDWHALQSALRPSPRPMQGEG